MIRLRSVVALPLLAGCLAVTACSSDPAAPPTLADQLQDDTGVTWGVYVSDASKEVRFLSPVTPVRIGNGTNEEDARAFFDRYRAQLHGTGKGDELRLVDTTTAPDGTMHLRFDHYVPGTTLPVFDVTTTAHFLPSGEAYWVRPGFRADLTGIATGAKISEADATKRATAHLAAACGKIAGATTIEATELGVRAEEGEPAALAFRVRATLESERCISPEVLIDAASGDVRALGERARAAFQTAPGARFYLVDDKTDNKTIDVSESIVFNDSMKSKSSPSVETMALTTTKASGNTVERIEKADGQWDPTEKRYRGVAVSAHFWGFHALRFFTEAKLTTCADQKLVVHDQSSKTGGTNAANVNGIVYFGDGDVLIGGNQMPGASAFDVVAHEITHGITQKTSKLDGKNQPGALDESFSDVMGAAAEEWFNETNDVQHPEMKNLVFGERWTKDGTGKRDMIDPSSQTHSREKRPGADPDHMSKLLACRPGEAPDSDANDGCFIHRNTGIPNRAFSLMTIGGTNKTSQISVAKGVGWETARSIWFKSITSLSAQSTFVEAALAQLVESLRTPDPAVFQAVGCAWAAVGVFDIAAPVDPRIALLSCPKANGAANPPPPPAPPPSKLTGSSASSCAGRGDAIVCDENAPTSANVCKNGGIVGTALCADLAQRCKKAGPSDWTGSLDANRDLVCE